MDKDIQEAARRFGRELARVREMTGMTQGRLANHLGVSSSHVSNMERGYRTPKGQTVALADKVLNAEGRLARLWEELTKSGRSAWLEELADLQRDAVSIMESQIALFPSLLQTEQYARSVASTLSPWATPEEADRVVKIRVERAERFISAQTPIYWVVIDQTAVTRQIGPDHLLKEQLAHVVELMKNERVSVQVATGRHPGLVGPFKIISPRSAPDVVYAESAHSGQIIDAPEDVRRFRLTFGAVQASALSVEESARLIERTLEGLGHG